VQNNQFWCSLALPPAGVEPAASLSLLVGPDGGLARSGIERHLVGLSATAVLSRAVTVTGSITSTTLVEGIRAALQIR
jgi:hypothetical protein